ncbi:MAG: hypothetical protein AAF503_05870 [Pseudomonadota bacterium]
MAKLCAIVGAGEGLGSALAARFASGGFDLALISRSPDASASAIEAARCFEERLLRSHVGICNTRKLSTFEV